MPWTRAIHLNQWADELASRSQLPHLVRRLIRATTPSLRRIDFPAFEQVGRTGFDGTVECDIGIQYVPSGQSRWELGTGKNPRAKANKDILSRIRELSPAEQSKLAFVFLTPRPWSKDDREEWIEKQKNKSTWREIHVLDGNDLEHWLEVAPDVDISFSRQIGHAPSGVQDLGSYWDALRFIADPPLTASVFTVSREIEVAVVEKWLGDSPASIFMRSHGLMEGLDFLAAISSDNVGLRDAVIVHTIEMWQDLSSMKDRGLILVPSSALTLQITDVSSAVTSGHRVFLSGPRPSMAATSDPSLPRQDCYSISKALVASGYSEAVAMSLALACCGSSSILKRLIARQRETTFPIWSQDDVRVILAPFALVGGWQNVSPTPPTRDLSLPRVGSDPPIDRLLVEELIQCNTTVLQALVTRWQTGFEPFFVQFGTAVFVASREDAWYLLGGLIAQDQLDRFCEYACVVLGEDNPALQLERDKRWMAAVFGKSYTLSNELRRSIVETLVLMAVSGQTHHDFCLAHRIMRQGP